MCTVTVIPLNRPNPGYRLVSSRDEERGRPIADPPRRVDLPKTGSRGQWPTDTLAGGTWIAGHDRGLALTLLNVNEPDWQPPKDSAQRTRGELIPMLIDHADAAAVMAALRRMELDAYRPFRLVAVSPRADGLPSVMDARWDGRGLDVTRHGTTMVCFASSGLGDALVRPRLPLFEREVVEAALGLPAARVHGGDSWGRAQEDPIAGLQDAFHRHVWPDRPELSVMMEREAARTVSVTSLEVRRREPPLEVSDSAFSMKMFYQPIVERPVPEVPEVRGVVSGGVGVAAGRRLG